MKYEEYRNNIHEMFEYMPEFCEDYYNERRIYITDKTQFDYISKLKIFLIYLCDTHPEFTGKKLKDIDASDLAALKRKDIVKFMSWLLDKKKYKSSSATNSSTTVMNYLSAISTYYSFFIKEGYTDENPVKAIERKKPDDKELIYLNNEQLEAFLYTVDTGAGLSEKSLSDFNSKTCYRDQCIIQLLRTTGIRVSELVGLDIADIDLNNSSISVQRKGNDEDTVYISDTTREMLKDYLENERIKYQSVDSLQPLFLSSKGKNAGTRLSVRSVERLVKKFAKASGIRNADKITPHKLRSTFAMMSLDTTGNVELVRTQLGHKSLTSTQHYVQSGNKQKFEHRNDID